jgi:predicted RNA polymerase sigma factor
VNTAREVEDLLREDAPRVLAALVRRYGQFDACEDAVQEALLAAYRQWPDGGVPRRPRAWLTMVAARALIDGWRADSARRRREARAALDPAARTPTSATGEPGEPGDTLTLLFLCCHPALSPPSQLALTLRAVGGLTTAQIAAGFLVPDAAIAKRISRAKERIRAAGARFEPPDPAQRDDRLGVVRHVLYLMFTEGHTASAGPLLHRVDLTTEAIRLTRLLHCLLPGDTETAGLLALMLLTDARRAARTDPDGSIVPLADQDRTRWETTRIAEGQALLTHTPMVTLSRAVAVAMVHGPTAGLALLGTLDAADRAAQGHRFDAVRAHLLEQAGDLDPARAAFLQAARATASQPEQRYLYRKAAGLTTLGARGGQP